MENMQAYSGSGRFAFVSYAHKDSQKVYPVISRLIDDGYNIWYDGGLPLIEEYPQVIIEKIQNCSVFMIFVSGNAVGSKDVNSELSNAYAKSKPILRINLDDSELPAAWQYFMPPSANYISAATERSIFFSKVEAALSQCRDDRHVTKAKAAPAESTVSGTAAAPVAKTSAKLNKRAFIIPLIICGICVLADVIIYQLCVASDSRVQINAIYDFLTPLLQLLSVITIVFSVIFCKKKYTVYTVTQLNSPLSKHNLISRLMGFLSLPIYIGCQLLCITSNIIFVLPLVFCWHFYIYGTVFSLIGCILLSRAIKNTSSYTASLSLSFMLNVYSLMLYTATICVICGSIMFSYNGVSYLNGIGNFLSKI